MAAAACGASDRCRRRPSRPRGGICSAAEAAAQITLPARRADGAASSWLARAPSAGDCVATRAPRRRARRPRWPRPPIASAPRRSARARAADLLVACSGGAGRPSASARRGDAGGARVRAAASRSCSRSSTIRAGSLRSGAARLATSWPSRSSPSWTASDRTRCLRRRRACARAPTRHRTRSAAMPREAAARRRCSAHASSRPSSASWRRSSRVDAARAVAASRAASAADSGAPAPRTPRSSPARHARRQERVADACTRSCDRLPRASLMAATYQRSRRTSRTR